MNDSVTPIQQDKKHKRWRLLADVSLQGQICIRVAFYWFLCQITLTGTIAVFQFLGSGQGNTPRLIIPALVVSTLFLPIALLDIIAFSNRFAGPLVSVRNKLNRLNSTGTYTAITVRGGDFYADLCDSLNTLLADRMPTSSETVVDQQDADSKESKTESDSDSDRLQQDPNLIDPELTVNLEGQQPSAPETDMKRLRNQKREKKVNKNKKHKRSRSGVATVEMAMVAPVIFLMIFGSIEMARMMMIRQSLTNASRVGARTACLVTTQDNDTADAEIRNTLRGVVTNAMQNEALRINISPNISAATPSGTEITVTVDVDCADVSWVPPFFTAGATIHSSAVMQRE